MTVHVVVDMQEDFVRGIFGTPEAQAIIPAVVAECKTAEDIIFTKDIHCDIDKTNNYELQQLPEHCKIDSRGSFIIPELIDYATTVIEKSTFGSYYLPVILMEKYHESMACGESFKVRFYGVCTDICVISNILTTIAQTNYAFPIEVVANACAGTTPEAHEAALKVLQSHLVTIV